MNDLAQGLSSAARLLSGADSELWSVVALSLQVSDAACLIGAAVGLMVGASLAVARFPGHALVVGVLNALLALPSVVVGLVVYLPPSRARPLGTFGILFTPAAMVAAQSILVVDRSTEALFSGEELPEPARQFNKGELPWHT